MGRRRQRRTLPVMQMRRRRGVVREPTPTFLTGRLCRLKIHTQKVVEAMHTEYL